MKALADDKRVAPLDQFKHSSRMAISTESCPGCGSAEISIFYEKDQAPVHSVLLLPTSEEAIRFKTGDIALGFCHRCSFISNYAFDPALMEYSSEYEANQSFSTTFNVFHKRLVEDLISRYGLRNKDIIEIGCGSGEFLVLLCELGDNRGVGFDPAYVSERHDRFSSDRITFIKDFFSEKYFDYKADFICCKMTLEHIHQTAAFMKTIRDSIADDRETMVFFQVPNILHILGEIGFWDIYYEHCSYFNHGSLGYLLQNAGFDVLDTWTDYDDQYLMITGQAARRPTNLPTLDTGVIDSVHGGVARFVDICQSQLEKWQVFLEKCRREKQRLVLWGSGSKAVSFLTTLKIYNDIEYIVDVNPFRQGSFSAGTGQEIVPPSFLKKYEPDIVIVMNPVYVEEIRQSLTDMGLSPSLTTILLEL